MEHHLSHGVLGLCGHGVLALNAGERTLPLPQPSRPVLNLLTPEGGMEG